MNAKLFLLTMLTVGMVFFSGCSDDDDDKSVLTVTESLTFTADGGEQSITVNSSDAWTLTQPDSWLTVSPASGQGGLTTVTVTVPASKNDIRTATLTFTNNSGLTATTKVTQGAYEGMPVVTTSTTVTALEGTTATLSGSYTFDGFQVPAAVGIAYKLVSENEFTNVAAAEVSKDFSVEITDLTPGAEYKYKAYVKMGESYIYGEEAGFTVPSLVDILFYESFDGGYNADTKTYTDGIAWSYRDNKMNDFDALGGFIRQGQPNVTYKIETDWSSAGMKGGFYNANSANNGWCSADLSLYPFDYPNEGTPYYEGASGNWGVFNSRNGDWFFVISNLDFSGASNLKLSCGVSDGPHEGASAHLNNEYFKIQVSSDGEHWSDITYTSTGSTSAPAWKFVETTGEITNTITSIRFSANYPQEEGGSARIKIDDIKVVGNK